jgi:hypothetical protein
MKSFRDIFIALYFHCVMEELRKISKNQIVMAFVATCIEATARQLNTSYNEVFQRMERIGLIDNYILPNYEPLHSESREVLVQRLIECLINWENRL